MSRSQSGRVWTSSSVTWTVTSRTATPSGRGPSDSVTGASRASGVVSAEYEVRVTPFGDNGVVVVTSDVTEQRRALAVHLDDDARGVGLHGAVDVDDIGRVREQRLQLPADLFLRLVVGSVDLGDDRRHDGRSGRNLDDLGIAHKTVEHPATFTVEEGRHLKASMPGGHSKNLFMKDKINPLLGAAGVVEAIFEEWPELAEEHHGLTAVEAVDWGPAPKPPGFIALRTKEAVTKTRRRLQIQPPPLPRSFAGARVASQRCPVLRAGDAMISPSYESSKKMVQHHVSFQRLIQRTAFRDLQQPVATGSK